MSKITSSDDFIPEVEEKQFCSIWWLLLIIPTICILVFAIWAKLDTPGIEKLVGEPNFKKPIVIVVQQPEIAYDKHPEPKGTKIVSGILTDSDYNPEDDILFIRMQTSDNKIWLLKHQRVSRIIDQENCNSFVVSPRDAGIWIKKHQEKGVAITAGIKNSIVEDVIMLVPLVD